MLGSVHASKKEVNIFQREIVTTGFLIYQKLEDKMCSILLKAKSGEFFNNGLKKLTPHENDSFDKNFDYVYEIDKVSPCSFLK